MQILLTSYISFLIGRKYHQHYLNLELILLSMMKVAEHKHLVMISQLLLMKCSPQSLLPMLLSFLPSLANLELKIVYHTKNGCVLPVSSCCSISQHLHLCVLGEALGEASGLVFRNLNLGYHP